MVLDGRGTQSLRPYGLFLIGAFLFNAGQAFLEVFHLNQFGIMGSNFTPQITLETLFLVLLCLACLHLGALLGALSDEGASAHESTVAAAPSASVDEIRWLGWAFLLISAVPAVFVLRSAVQVALSQGYAALYSPAQFTTGLATSPRILASFLVPAGLFLLVGGRKSRITVAISAITVLSYSVTYFFLGDRHTAAMPLLMYAWLWDRY